MPKILIDILPALGHFNSSLKIVQMLKSEGWEVIYINQGLKAEIARYGLQSCSTGFDISPLLLKKGDFKLRKLLNNALRSKKEDVLSKIQADFKTFKKFINDLSPDLVLLDEQNMLKAIYYELCNIPVICIESKPEPCKFDNVPPFTSFYIPSNTHLSRLVCSWLWLIKIIRNKLKLKIIQFSSGGSDIYSVTCKIAGENGIELKRKINLKRGYGIGIDGISRLNISAADFDFPHPGKEDTYYVGPLIDIDRETNINMPRYKVLREDLKLRKEKGEDAIIYCSMGSHNVLFQKKILQFFKKMKEVARLSPKDLFVLSTGEDFNITELFPVPDNMYIFEYLPQTDLLKYCDIMITHGGINSITECVFYGVPILNYPVSTDWDQPGCAVRAVYHNIGLMGKIKIDSAKAIFRKLNRIKSDYRLYKMNMLAMKKKFEVKNNSNKVIEIIDNLIKHNAMHHVQE